jgi:DNA-binding transcriptional regulator YiaG
MNETPLKQPKTPAPGTVAQRVRQTVDRLNLDEGQAAAYFGVPVYTVRKWCTGEREPGAAVARLLEVMGMLEALAPNLHQTFLVNLAPPAYPGQTGHPLPRR